VITSQLPGPLAPLPIRPPPQRGETTESYARRLARANHLKPSYLRSVLSGSVAAAIRPSQLAALSGRSLHALEHALADLATQPSSEPRQAAWQRQLGQDNPGLFTGIRRDAVTDQMSIRALAARHHVGRRTIRQALTQAGLPPLKRPPARRARVGLSARPLIRTWLLAQPGITAIQIWERLLDEHDADISYATVLHYCHTMTSRPNSMTTPGQKPHSSQTPWHAPGPPH
jgi:hypothetical protein